MEHEMYYHTKRQESGHSMEILNQNKTGIHQVKPQIHV